VYKYKIRKVYDEKIALLDKQLSQEIKQYQTETRQMKIVITQLVKQKKELENKLKNNKKTPVPIIKPPVPSSPNLKKPNPLKSTNITAKEALTLKTPVFIKFN
jgi:hypothetical protein